MKKIRNLIAALLISLTMSGCTALQSIEVDNLGVAITYGTLKVIERDNGIGGDDVLRVMDELDAVLNDEEVATQRLREEALKVIGYDRLDAADRFLVSTLLGDIEDTIRKNPDSFENDSQVRIRLSELVDYVRRAALMAD